MLQCWLFEKEHKGCFFLVSSMHAVTKTVSWRRARRKRATLLRPSRLKRCQSAVGYSWIVSLVVPKACARASDSRGLYPPPASAAARSSPKHQLAHSDERTKRVSREPESLKEAFRILSSRTYGSVPGTRLGSLKAGGKEEGEEEEGDGFVFYNILDTLSLARGS